MNPTLTPSPGHVPTDPSQRNPDPRARVTPDIAPPAPENGPSTPSRRDPVRSPRFARRQAATHLPHWKIRTWPRHRLGTYRPDGRRHRDWMRLRRVKGPASRRTPQGRRDDEGLHQEPYDDGTAPETGEGEDGRAGLVAPHQAQ